MKKSPPSAGYDVGYGKPPEHTRFKKGASGNPKGRPKGKLNVATVLNKTLNEKVTITDRGKRRTITMLEATFKQLVHKAVQGDPRAMGLLLSFSAMIGAEPATGMQSLDTEETAVLASLVERFGGRSEEGDA